MHALVVYGSKRGGTAGLANMIGDALSADGFTTDVRDARTCGSPAGYDVVIIAGALYASRWHRDARRYARRHAKMLRQVPVWLVASGPLDDTARAATLPPVPQVAKLADRLGARSAVTFGGRLAADATGFPARAMAKTRAGDWRDPEQVREFVATVVRSTTDPLDEGSIEMHDQGEIGSTAQQPRIDLTPAVGTAGDEAHVLGYDGVADTGPVLDDHSDDGTLTEEHLEAAIARFPLD